MMEDTEHEVVLYGGEDNEAPCDEYVQIVSKRQQRRWFGKPQPDLMYPITWNPVEDHWIDTNRAVIKNVQRGLRSGKYDKRDLMLIIAGTCNQQIDMHLPLTSVEYGVGYTGVFTHAAYESVSHRHTVYSIHGIGDGRSFDTVIPNYFDPEEFTASVKGNAERGDHLLYVGRVIVRKGVHVAAKVAEATGRKLLVAGQGVLDHKTGEFITSEEMTLHSPSIEFIGTLGVEERAYEMGRAHAVLAPTQYVEPFGGVAVEAGFSGTPVITTNWGAYTETVVEGVTGFRPDTLSEFVDAVNACGRLKPNKIRQSVESRYSLDAVRPLFEEWFRKIDTLWEAGWYQGFAHLEKGRG